MPPCWVGHNYDSCARFSYSPWQSEFLGGLSGPSLFIFFDSVVAKAGFGGEQRQSRFDGAMAWWPAAMLSARVGTGRREHLSPLPRQGVREENPPQNSPQYSPVDSMHRLNKNRNPQQNPQQYSLRYSPQYLPRYSRRCGGQNPHHASPSSTPVFATVFTPVFT